MYGSIKDLANALRAGLPGVTVLLGSENMWSLESGLPVIVMIPRSGSYIPGIGYIRQADVNIDIIWGLKETIDFHLWAVAEDPGAIHPDDDFEACEDLRQKLLAALKAQQFVGFAFEPLGETWIEQKDQNTTNRALVQTFRVEFSVPDTLPPEVEIKKITISDPV